MGEKELKQALQHNGEAQIRDFWQKAEAAVSSRREVIEAELTRLRAKSDNQLQAEATTLRNNLLFEAQTRAMGCRLHAEAELDEHLLHLARQYLPELASANRSTLWKALCEELPAIDWKALKVHPTDHALASRDFLTAAIETDESLGGGLIATNGDGTICIDNSLNCRLMRAWPDLLPRLLGELRKRVNDYETAHTDTTG